MTGHEILHWLQKLAMVHLNCYKYSSTYDVKKNFIYIYITVIYLNGCSDSHKSSRKYLFYIFDYNFLVFQNMFIIVWN